MGNICLIICNIIYADYKTFFSAKTINLSKRSSIDWHHFVLGAEVDIVVVDRVPGDADALYQVIVLVQPDQRGGGGVPLGHGGGVGGGEAGVVRGDSVKLVPVDHGGVGRRSKEYR